VRWAYFLAKISGRQAAPSRALLPKHAPAMLLAHFVSDARSR
jgi:hypothetical protein